MANTQSTKDILKGALEIAGELTDGNSDFQQAGLKHLNKAHRDILDGGSFLDVEVGETWSFLRARQPLNLILEPAYVDGTVAITNGVNTGTFSTPPAASQKDRYLKVGDNRPTFYKITAHTGGAGPFTLDSIYVEETAAAIDFKSVKLIYNLGSGVLRLLEPFRVYATETSHIRSFDDDGEINVNETNRFRHENPLKFLLEGIPDRYTTIFRDETEWLIQFNRFPTKQTKIDIDFLQFPTDLIDSDESFPVLPREYAPILENYTGAMILSIDKSDDRAPGFFAAAKQLLLKIREAEKRQVTHGTKNKGRLIPRPEQMNRHRRFFFR